MVGGQPTQTFLGRTPATLRERACYHPLVGFGSTYALPTSKARLVLADFNHRWSHPTWGRLLSVFVCVASTLFFIAHMQRKGTLDQPPESGGDAPDYDLIAWGLTSGHGFHRDSQAAEFLAPYQQAGRASPAVPVSGPVTDRPPLYPLILAATYESGRQFRVIRICQALCLGLVIGAITWQVFELAGVIPALLCPALMLIVDPRLRTMANEILTEAWACGLVTLLFLQLMKWDRKRRWIDAVLTGVVLGILVMCRTMMVMWLPLLAIGMWWQTERPDRWRTVRHTALLSTVAIAVCLPWWIHNVQVLGEFRPLGTQGAEQLSAAYSDEAFARRGMWFNLDETEFFRGIDQPDPVRRTLARALLSEQSARTWVGQHPLQAASLWPARVFQEFRPHGPGDLFVLAFALLGLAILWQTPPGRASRWLIAGQVLAIAATWSVAGRFVFPLLGILHLLATIGLWGAYVALVERREMSRLWILRNDPVS